MFSKFSEEAQKILLNAKKEMTALKHPYVGSEHLLLAILYDKELDVTIKLNEYNINYNSFKEEVVKVIGKGNLTNNWFLYTPLLKRIIESATIECKENKDKEVTPLHLFLALLEEGDGVAIRILMGINIDIDAIVGKTSDNEDIFLWELLLRADDTLLNTYKYEENTANWWSILLNNSNNPLLEELYKKVCEVNNYKNAYALKEKVQKFLLETFEIKTDGFKTIEMPNFKKFFSYLTEVMNYKCVFPEITKNYELQCEKKDISFLEEIKKEYDVKTLAIINKNTVSFSYNIKDK